MKLPFDFSIDPSKGDISRLFFEKNISTFIKASRWVNDLPYRRNENKNTQTTLFKEECGTCSTKHALLKDFLMKTGTGTAGHIKFMICGSKPVQTKVVPR
jgi:hypothetical protein